MIRAVKSVGAKIAAAAVMAGAYGTSALAVEIGGNEIKPLILSNLDMDDILGNIMNVILLVAGILAVAYLIYGGILYVMAGGDSDKASKGRVAITNSIIGIILIILALVIYNTVTGAVTTGSI